MHDYADQMESDYTIARRAESMPQRETDPYPDGQAPCFQYNHNPRTLEEETRNEIIRQSAGEMVECLIQAEFALFEAETQGKFNIYTTRDIQDARARIRLALEAMSAGKPAGL